MSSIGSSDQACKECRRRKARCDKVLPTCSLCIKYRRHCLYEKHSRTPLTRKHLTEVEERLERAEALVQQMRGLIPSNLRTWERQNSQPAEQQADETDFDFSAPPDGGQDISGSGIDMSPIQVDINTAPQRSTPLPNQEISNDVVEGSGSDGRQLDESQRNLESPPLYDFEWCEKEAGHIQGLSPKTAVEGHEEESPISDGMASLSVNEREGGYLGVASGAAMLRLIDPVTRRRASSRPQPVASITSPITPQPSPNRHIAETMIDAYFRLYHVSYPIVHEPTFRAQYSELIARPNGPCWTILAYIVAAIGVWVSSTTSNQALDLALFNQARSMLNFDFLEIGNLTLVQALTLFSNYQQKRDKPNSGYNYLGLAVRMAMGLGLHKEFQGWNISPLNMEIRRRVWWSLCVFDVGATITFSRPDVWPYKGVEVSFPLNVNDKDLTAASQSYPQESNQITPYTAVAVQARFHVAAHYCYEKIISRPFPTAEELLHLDSEHIEPWRVSIPAYFSEKAAVPSRYALSHAVMSWRLWNLRIVMYRPFVIRFALKGRTGANEASRKAFDQCLADAASSIKSIADFWKNHEHNRLAAWYSLYFLFQAVLVPCICLRNDPAAEEAANWRVQIISTLHVITALSSINISSDRCHQIILDLCGRYLDYRQEQPGTVATSGNRRSIEGLNGPANIQVETWPEAQAVNESPQTQINNIMNMMWPNVHPMEAADVVMGDQAGWMDFLSSEASGLWNMSDT
ncbi:C6 transcription factor [Fusarium austroafricanum]|uniref:C6 transcription factor n=1 Tax=Fusarium austroafricanum TaxID=2364996 RepID=A0A8H4KY15_9HYPO|nr:C6 transcription factor [Fusarium austroafricanum]